MFGGDARADKMGGMRFTESRSSAATVMLKLFSSMSDKHGNVEVQSGGLRRVTGFSAGTLLDYGPP